MLLPWHKSDYPKVPDEERAREGLRALAIPPGDYMIPRPSSMGEMKSPAFQEKMKQGPVAIPHRHAERPGLDGKAAGALVCLLRRGRVFRRVRRESRPAARSALPAGLPARGRHRIHRLQPCALADVDLVSTLLDHDDQGERRWSRLRPPHRRRLCVAGAALACSRSHLLRKVTCRSSSKSSTNPPSRTKA